MAQGLLDFDVTLVGVEPVKAKLGLAARAVGDLRPAWKQIHEGPSGVGLLAGGGASFVDIIQGQFASKGRRGNTPWAGYDAEPVYKRIKIKYGGGTDRILRWVEGKERLFPSLARTSHPEHLFTSGRHSVAMGTTVPYAARHQQGDGRQPYDKIPLPRRPIIALTSFDTRAWFRAIARHIGGEGIRQARVVR